MDPSDPEVQAMLTQARDKATRLLEELLKQQAEVEANPPDIPVANLAEGRHAMQQAIRSARNMLASLDAAAEISHQADN